MYTEEDLRATFDALERDAPDPVDAVEGMHRLRARRTKQRRTIGIAAALVTVTLAAATFLLPHTLDRQPAAASGRDLLRFSFSVDRIPDIQVMYRNRSKEQQWATVANGAGQSFLLVVYAPGKYGDEDAAEDGRPVEVNGKDGYYRTDMPCPSCIDHAKTYGLVWEYAPDAWASVQNASSQGASMLDGEPELTRIAQAVRFDRSTPIRLPFRLGYLPGGLQPDGIESVPPDLTDNKMAGRSEVNLSDGSGNRRVHIESVDPRLMNQPTGRPVTSPGGSSVLINLGGIGLRLSGQGIPIGDLERIAGSIAQAADAGDPATWFDAEEAVPVE